MMKELTEMYFFLLLDIFAFWGYVICYLVVSSSLRDRTNSYTFLESMTWPLPYSRLMNWFSAQVFVKHAKRSFFKKHKWTKIAIVSTRNANRYFLVGKEPRFDSSATINVATFKRRFRDSRDYDIYAPTIHVETTIAVCQSRRPANYLGIQVSSRKETQQEANNQWIKKIRPVIRAGFFIVLNYSGPLNGRSSGKSKTSRLTLAALIVPVAFRIQPRNEWNCLLLIDLLFLAGPPFSGQKETRFFVMRPMIDSQAFILVNIGMV